MKTDAYLKTILTIIALTQIGILLKDSPVIPTANAQYSSDSTILRVDIAKINGIRLDDESVGSIVPALPINIKRIGDNGFFPNQIEELSPALPISVNNRPNR